MVKINILQAHPKACVLKARRHKSFSLIEAHTSWQEMKEINITSILLKKQHVHAHIILIAFAAASTLFPDSSTGVYLEAALACREESLPQHHGLQGSEEFK